MASLPRLRPQVDGLKPSLSAWLQMHPYRQRAKAMDVRTVTAQPYHYQEHGTDVLLYWYAQVWQLGEHLGLFGAFLGGSPSRFVTQAVGWEIYFLVNEETPLQGLQDIIAVLWGDDGQQPVRQRVHCWVAPAYRHPAVTDALAHAALAAFFAHYALLWCIIPAVNKTVLRASRRWGFRSIGRLPQSEDMGGLPVDGIVSYLTRDAFEAQDG